MAQSLTVNMNPGNHNGVLHASQGDVGREFVIRLVDNTGVYIVPDGATVKIEATKPSGLGFSVSASVSGSTVTVLTTDTMTNEPGKIPCELKVSKTGLVLGSSNFILNVEEDPHPEGTTDGDAEQLISEITILVERAETAESNAATSATSASTSASNAASSASSASSSASSASTSAANGAESKTAAETAQAAAEAAQEAAEEAVEEIETFAKVDGNYPDLTSGSSLQLLADKGAEDQVPYNFRHSGGGVKVGDREVDKIVGGSLVWNQLVQNGDFEENSGWIVSNGATMSIANNKATVSQANQTNTYFSFTLSSTRQSKAVPGHKYLFNTYVKSDNEIGILPGGSFSYGGKGYFYTLANGDYINYIWNPDSDYYISAEIRVYTGNNITADLSAEISNYTCFDLTAMFGSTIADYIYSLEQANAGAGIAWFKKLFPKPYYEYAPVGIESVKAGEHRTTGFNQWDEEWEVGAYNSSNGSKMAYSGCIRSKNYISVIPETAYYFNTSGKSMTLFFYDKNKQYIGGNVGRNNQTYTTNSKTHYMTFMMQDAYGTTYNHDICINLHWDGERDGDYEPYVKHTYPLDNTLELRGIPKLDSNNQLYFDGDTYESDGTVTRRYGIVDLGTLDWMRNSSTANPFLYAAILSKINNSINYALMSSVYVFVSGNIKGATSAGNTLTENKTFGVSNGTTIPYVYIRDDSYTDAATFKTAMSGVYLVYELAEPTTEQAVPYTNPQIVDDWGTEEYTDYAYEAGDRDVAIPVGHVTQYPENLREKIEGLPWNLSMIAPIENGATASKGYSSGEYFLKDDQFCKALTSIASGATFTLNTNYSITTVAAEIYAAMNA